MALPSSLQRDSKHSPAPLGQGGPGWARGTPGAAQPQRGDPLLPLACVFSLRQVSSPATHQPSGSTVVLPGPAHPQRAPTGTKHLLLLTPSEEEGNNQPGMAPQSPRTFHLQHKLKPIPTLKSILCVTKKKKGIFWREMSEEIHPQLWSCPNSWKQRQEIPESFTFTSFPPFQASRCRGTQP